MRRFATDYTEKLTAKFAKFCAKNTKEFASDFTKKITAKFAKVCALNTKEFAEEYTQQTGYFTDNEYLL